MTNRETYVDTHTIAGNRVDIDVPARIAEIRTMLPGNGRRSETIYKEGGLTLVLITQEAGDTIPAHSASGTSTLHILDGRVEITSDREAETRTAGQLVAFGPNVAHDVRAVEPSVILLTVSLIADDPGDDDATPPRGPGV